MTIPNIHPIADDGDWGGVIPEEASTLGFPVNRWPETFRYDGRRMFLLRIERNEEGETLWADYGCDGAVLRVFND